MTTDPAGRLRASAQQVARALDERYAAIEYAREHGLTWQQIGDALGMRPSGAHAWFTRNTDLPRRARA